MRTGSARHTLARFDPSVSTPAFTHGMTVSTQATQRVWADVFDSKELTNCDRFAGIVVMRGAGHTARLGPQATLCLAGPRGPEDLRGPRGGESGTVTHPTQCMIWFDTGHETRLGGARPVGPAPRSDSN